MKKNLSDSKTICVITATYNAMNHLPELVKSLHMQTDQNFEWIVADGNSNDGTYEYLNTIQDLNLVVSRQADFGIYDALNRAIKASQSDYYIVSGADDVFESDAIANFRSSIEESNADLIISKALFGVDTLSARKNSPWLWGHMSYIASHTLATAFRKDLHNQYGFYSRKYPIAADQFFVMKVCDAGVSRKYTAFTSGTVGHGGVSTTDLFGNAVETFRVQVDLGRNQFVQLILLVMRLIKCQIHLIFKTK